MPDGWGSNAAQRIKSMLEEERQAKASMQLEEKLRAEQGPSIWKALRALMEERCLSLNAEFGSPLATWLSLAQDEFEVRLSIPNKGTRSLHAKFQVTSGPDALSWHTSGTMSPRSTQCGLVIQGGTVFLGSGQFTSENSAIADAMFDAIITG